MSIKHRKLYNIGSLLVISYKNYTSKYLNIVFNKTYILIFAKMSFTFGYPRISAWCRKPKPK